MELWNVVLTDTGTIFHNFRPYSKITWSSQQYISATVGSAHLCHILVFIKQVRECVTCTLYRMCMGVYVCACVCVCVCTCSRAPPHECAVLACQSMSRHTNVSMCVNRGQFQACFAKHGWSQQQYPGTIMTPVQQWPKS